MTKFIIFISSIFAFILPHSIVLADSGEPFSTHLELSTWWVVLIFVMAGVGTVSLATYLIIQYIHNKKNKK